MEDFSLLPQLWMYSIIYINMDSWMFILYIGLNSNTSLFVAQIIPALAIRSSQLAALFL